MTAFVHNRKAPCPWISQGLVRNLFVLLLDFFFRRKPVIPFLVTIIVTVLFKVDPGRSPGNDETNHKERNGKDWGNTIYLSIEEVAKGKDVLVERHVSRPCDNHRGN